MTMTIQDLGALGEFFGSIAVLATLVYLALQTRQNTLALRSSSHSSNSLFIAGLCAQVAGQGTELARILTAATQVEHIGDDPLRPEEWLRFSLWNRGIFFGCEDMFQQYDSGTLAPSVWEFRAKFLKSLTRSSPAHREWWQAESAAGAFNPRYVEAIDSIELDIPGEYLFDLPQASP
jgi:hypothetical protein